MAVVIAGTANAWMDSAGTVAATVLVASATWTMIRGVMQANVKNVITVSVNLNATLMSAVMIATV